MELKNIKLGADTAEKDIHIGLMDYFYQNEAYRNLLKSSKHIIVGNRGVGKSAIFKYLSVKEKRSGAIILELSPEDYSYEILQQALLSEGGKAWGKQSAYGVAWQYLIFNLVFKALVGDCSGIVRGPLKHIYAYVRDSLKTKDINPIGMLISYLKRLEGIKIGPYEAGLKTRELQSLYKLEEIHALMPPLKDILSSKKVLIFIDELDKGWDNSEDAKYFIAGLFQASQKINQLHDNMKIFLSIRQELFDNIPQIYDDAQKIREDIQVIRWSEEDLLTFIGLRIIKSASAHDLSVNDAWNLVFTEVLEYRGANSFNYIVDRTQLRPRELLQFCKACIEKAPAQKYKIDYQDITRAEIDYSEQKAKDLASEYRFQHPNLLDLFELFRGKKYTFEKDDLDYLLLGIVDGEYNVGNAKWVLDMDYAELKRILWEVGFIKAWVIGGLKFGRKSGSSYLGYYELSHINLENITRFQIHPAFRTFLTLKEK